MTRRYVLTVLHTAAPVPPTSDGAEVHLTSSEWHAITPTGPTPLRFIETTLIESSQAASCH